LWLNAGRVAHVDRREFLALASAFGATTAMAYGMIGLAAPTPAWLRSRRRAA
jgi:peptide/nickel transport system substrate-binding protein